MRREAEQSFPCFWLKAGAVQRTFDGRLPTVAPASQAVRALSLIEEVIGIVYVATMIARFASIQTSGKFERSLHRLYSRFIRN